MNKSIFIGILAVFTIIPVAFAHAFSASIITRPGTPTSLLKIPFNPSSCFNAGINQNVKVTITALNSQQTALAFNEVRLLGNKGNPIGNNLATKTDALSKTAYNFIFGPNWGVSSEELKAVTGIGVSFIDSGGFDSTGKAHITGVDISCSRQVGNQCVVINPAAQQTKEKPPVTVASIQQVQVSRSGGVASGSAATAGPRGGGTFSSVGGPPGDWNTPQNAGLSDNIYTTVLENMEMGRSAELQARNFGFSIPSTATINGIEFTVELRNAGNVNVWDYFIGFVRGGVMVGTNFARGSGVLWPTSDTNVTFGGPTQLAGVSWTAADINNTNFGINITAASDGLPIDLSANIDYISAKVYYTTASASVYDALFAFFKSAYAYFSRPF